MTNGNCGRRRGRPVGSLNSLGGLHPWGVFWNGGCPDAGGCGGDPEPGERFPGRRRDEVGVFGLFTASLPMAVPPNGVIPLAGGPCGCGGDIAVNSGVITLYRPGIYLATVTARVGADTAVDSTITLNVNEASLAPAVLELSGAGPVSSTSQALFEVCGQALVTLRSVDAINIATPAAQPLFTLSLVQLET